MIVSKLFTGKERWHLWALRFISKLVSKKFNLLSVVRNVNVFLNDGHMVFCGDPDM